MKRVFALLFVVLLCAALFVGCGSDKNGDSSASGGITADDGIFFKGKIEYKDSNGESVYRVIRPDGDTKVTTVAASVFKAVKDTVGVSIKNQTDSEDGTDVYEILVGNTNRPETESARQYLAAKHGGRFEDFIVCSIGKKIVIYSPDVSGLEKAAQYFITNFVKAEGIDGGILYSEAAKGNYETVTVNGVSIGSFKFVRPHFNSSYLTELEIEKAVQSLVTNAGYRLSMVHDNVAATDYEIIVGNADRDGVEFLSDVNSYKIAVMGKKVYLNGGSAHATALAVSEFAKMLKGDVKDTVVDGNYNTAISSYDDKTTLKYAWGDDFNGDVLDVTKWYQSTPKESGVKGENGKTSVRSDDPSDVFLNDGKFHICARQDDSYYYGGRISSQKTMRYKYGYLEMSAVIPHGTDFWVALWVCSDSGKATADQMNMYSEIDVVECFGNSAIYYANCHSWPTVYGEQNGFEHTSLDETHANEKKYQCPDGKLLTEGFHTYGMMWDSESMTFVCDGNDYFKYVFRDDNEDKNTFNQEMYLLISMALGFANNSMSINDARPEDWENTNKYIIDWVNIYQKNDGISYVKMLG
ncbi:MAG: glycoside hydrolase family 16 protein [Clostridia bacterium]|nr:glycoside hydrolase family 16 protein [Clostridia bacterium]